MNCYLYKIPASQETLHLLSPLNKEELAKLTSKSELFLGRLIDSEKEIVHENISYNADFLVVLHRIVRDYMVTDAEVIEQARKQLNGFVFIVDRRATEEEVEKEDIIGIYLVSDSVTDVSRYRPNPDYKLISRKGPGMFHDEVEMELVKVLMEL